MNLLIYFALPIATIIISAVLQKFIKNPIWVAAVIFAIFLVVTFAAFDETFLIATLAYTLLSLATAFIVSRLELEEQEDNDEEDDNVCCCSNREVNSTLSYKCGGNRYRRF